MPKHSKKSHSKKAAVTRARKYKLQVRTAKRHAKQPMDMAGGIRNPFSWLARKLSRKQTQQPTGGNQIGMSAQGSQQQPAAARPGFFSRLKARLSGKSNNKKVTESQQPVRAQRSNPFANSLVLAAKIVYDGAYLFKTNNDELNNTMIFNAFLCYLCKEYRDNVINTDLENLSTNQTNFTIKDSYVINLVGGDVGSKLPETERLDGFYKISINQSEPYAYNVRNLSQVNKQANQFKEINVDESDLPNQMITNIDTQKNQMQKYTPKTQQIAALITVSEKLKTIINQFMNKKTNIIKAHGQKFPGKSQQQQQQEAVQHGTNMGGFGTKPNSPFGPAPF